MYGVDEALKTLYKKDTINKNMIAEFYHPGGSDPFYSIHDERKIVEMFIEESLSSDENLEFGSCEAAQVKITLLEKPESSIKGCDMVLYQTLDGMFPETDLYPGEDAFPAGYTMPLGRYVIQSAERQENSDYWDITALDYMSKFDVNVIDWYNALEFPLTLRDFRASLCRYIGVTEDVPDYLPNDGMTVEKTIDAAELPGRTVLIACEQANGVFGHFDRNGVLQHVALQPNDRLVPAADLYPSEDLYPDAPGEMNTQVYDEQLDPYLLISCQFEEYTVKSIDTVQIRQEEGDIGAIYGEGGNCYTVEGNFLLYGKSADELAQAARGIYCMVIGRSYIPYSSYNKGLPYIETGDAVRFDFGGESIVSYVIKRTLKGVYALKDSYSATGDEHRRTESNINTEIIQLKEKSAILKKTVDEVSVNLTDLEKKAEAQFSVMADEILMKVSKGDVSSQISVESGLVDIRGDRFSWASTYSSMTAEGKLSVVEGFFSGSIDVGDGNFTVDSQGRVVAKDITIGTISTKSVGYFSTLLADDHTCNRLIVQEDADVGLLTASQIECASTIECSQIYSAFADEWWSDRRLKHDIKDLPRESAVRILSELRPVSFVMNKGGLPGMGFVAQDVIDVCSKYDVNLPLYGMHDGYYTIPYTNYIPLIVAALQEIIDNLKRREGPCTK